MSAFLAVASGGGHWVQLMRLRSSFSAHEVVYLSTEFELDKAYDISNYHRVVDANLSAAWKLVVQALSVLLIMVRVRPDVVISTGASVGFFALLWAKILRKRTIWVDSIANSAKISVSGKYVKKMADLWLTQWPELAEEEGPHFRGQVI